MQNRKTFSSTNMCDSIMHKVYYKMHTSIYTLFFVKNGKVDISIRLMTGF